MASLKTLFRCLPLIMLLMFFSSAEARDFLVGGQQNSWKIPSSPDQFNKWAEKTRFRIGDSLVIEYDSQSDSVLEVTEADYKSCNRSTPLKSYHDGKTKIELDRSGPFFFISGADGHCEKGQKLEVQVLSAKHSGWNPSHTPAPSPSPAPAPAPALAPSPTSSGFGFKVEGLAFLMATLVGFAMLFEVS